MTKSALGSQYSVTQSFMSTEPWLTCKPWCRFQEQPSYQKFWEVKGREAPIYNALMRMAATSGETRTIGPQQMPRVHLLAILIDRIVYPIFALFSYLFLNDNHLMRALKDWQARDRFLKFAIVSAETAAYIAERQGASSEKVGHLHAVRQGFKDARLAVGIFNLFAGVIPGLIKSIQRIVALGKELYHPQSNLSDARSQYQKERERVFSIQDINSSKGVQEIRVKTYEKLAQKEARAIWRERTRSRSEICLDIIHELAELGGGASYLVAFGVCRPIQFAERYTGQLGAGAHRMGQAFGLLMMARHAASFISSGAHLCVLYLGKDDYFSLVHHTYLVGDPKDLTMAYVAENQYNWEVVQDLLNLLDQGVGLFVDAIKNFEAVRTALPPPLYLSLSLTSVSIGLVRLWVKTT